MAGERMIFEAAKALETMLPGAERALGEVFESAQHFKIGPGIARLNSNAAHFMMGNDSVSMVSMTGSESLPNFGIALSDGSAMAVNNRTMKLATADGRTVVAEKEKITFTSADQNTLSLNLKPSGLTGVDRVVLENGIVRDITELGIDNHGHVYLGDPDAYVYSFSRVPTNITNFDGIGAEVGINSIPPQRLVFQLDPDGSFIRTKVGHLTLSGELGSSARGSRANLSFNTGDRNTLGDFAWTPGDGLKLSLDTKFLSHVLETFGK